MKGVSVNNFLLKISIYRFLEALKLVGAIFTLLFAHNGMNPFQISLLISFWSISQIVLEVPLGTVADKYPRRNLLIIALFIQIFGFVLWMKGGFTFYALGFVLWGIKNALTSGTLEAFVYDELKARGEESSYEQVNGKMEGVFWAGMTIAAILGGIIANFDYSLVLIASIVTTVFAAIALLTIKSVRPQKSTGEAKYFDILKGACREVKTNTVLLGIIAFFCLVFATYGAADEYWGLIYQVLGLPVSVIGILIAVGYGFFTLAGWSLKFFDQRLQGKEHFLILVSAGLFILAGIVRSYVSIPLIFLAMYIFKVAHLKFDAKFQHAIKADQRATISSLKSLIFEIVYMGFVLMFGFGSSKLGIISVTYFLGILLIVWITIFKVFFERSLTRILSAEYKVDYT